MTGTKRVVKPSADAPVATKKARLSDAQRVAKISAAMATILDCLHDDPRREGLKKTPLRYAKVRRDDAYSCDVLLVCRFVTG